MICLFYQQSGSCCCVPVLPNSPFVCFCYQGSGKTLAFGIPLVHHILMDKQTEETNVNDDSMVQTSEAEDDNNSHTSDGNGMMNN